MGMTLILPVKDLYHEQALACSETLARKRMGEREARDGEVVGRRLPCRGIYSNHTQLFGLGLLGKPASRSGYPSCVAFP